MVEESMVIGISGEGSSRRPRSIKDCRARGRRRKRSVCLGNRKGK
jgi:hypothetical protein